MAARLAVDRHGRDIAVLDLRGISPVTDYFVIITGTSDRQMRAVADEIVQEAAPAGWKPYNPADTRSDKWVLVDFVDVVVHVFEQAARRFYDLELIWGDAPRVRWQRRTRAAAAKAQSPDTSAAENEDGSAG